MLTPYQSQRFMNLWARHHWRLPKARLIANFGTPDLVNRRGPPALWIYRLAPCISAFTGRPILDWAFHIEIRRTSAAVRFGGANNLTTTFYPKFSQKPHRPQVFLKPWTT